MISKARDLQADVSESAYKVWLAGLGAVAYAQEAGGQMFTDLVKRGREVEAHVRLSPPEMKVTLRDATGRAKSVWQQITKGLDEQVTIVLHGMGVPTRSEIATLAKRVEMLTASIEKLKPRARALAKPIERTTRPTTTTAPKSQS